jgi:hypothetical protein
MTIRNIALLAMLLALPIVEACENSSSFKSPFGIWSTERGQTVEVFRNGLFRYCDGSLCENGKYMMDGPYGVNLVGFSNMKATSRLRKLSGWDEYLALRPAMPMSSLEESGFELGDGGMFVLQRLVLCLGRPCRIIGRVKGDIYRFVKTKDY